MKKTKLVITDYIENDLDYEKEMALQMGIDLEDHQLKHAPEDQLIEAVRDADVVLVNMARFTRGVISNLKNCRMILRHGIGYDNVEIPAATEAGIVVANYPTYCVRDVAEQAVMLMLACQRKLLVQNRLLERSVEAGKWIFKDAYPVFRMKGKKVGIIGLGRIGGTVFRMLSGFEIEFLICDPYISEKRLEEYGVERLPFEEVISAADIVTIHCPLTWEETYHMFDAPQFDLMQETSILINTARGGIVNIQALDAALREGKLAAAGIDVYENEPPRKELGILTNPRAICTPHLSWLSEEAGMTIRQEYMDDMRRFLNGQGPKFVLNPQVETSLVL